MSEPLPLATIHDAVLQFLSGRADAVLFGAQAVNAYVDEPRMTQGVDVLSSAATELAEALQKNLSERFHIAIRLRDLGEGKGLRIYQVAKPKNRHLVDVRPVTVLPPARLVPGVWVGAPEELIAQKVTAFHIRRGKPKAFSDRRDLAVLLLAFPELKTVECSVQTRLKAAHADTAILDTWRAVVAEEIVAEDDDDSPTQ